MVNVIQIGLKIIEFQKDFEQNFWKLLNFGEEFCNL